MKWIKLILYISIVTLTVFKFQGLEQFLLRTSVSWSFSKLAPYLTLVIGGLLIASWIRENTSMSKVVKQILFWIILVIPFVVGFVFNPIYQGDFAKRGTKITKEIEMMDFVNADLLVISIPGCPYCHGAVPSLKTLKERNPNLRVRMVVCSSDPKELEPYKNAIGNDFDLQLAQDIDSMAIIAGYSFPTFVMVKNDMPAVKWSNDQFGVGAKDMVEKYFKR